MTTCVTERQLVELSTGDGDAATRAHVSACAACATRLTALERDLTMLRTALSEAPATVAVARRPWLPIAAAAAMAAALFVFTLMPGGVSSPTSVATAEPQTDFAVALSNALFADASLDTADPGSTDWELETALNGGTLCTGGYTGEDCTAEVLLADYE